MSTSTDFGLFTEYPIELENHQQNEDGRVVWTCLEMSVRVRCTLRPPRDGASRLSFDDSVDAMVRNALILRTIGIMDRIRFSVSNAENVGCISKFTLREAGGGARMVVDECDMRILCVCHAVPLSHYSFHLLGKCV